MKLFEAGKFYLNHRDDAYGKRILEEHYEALKDWCDWVILHMNEDGLVLDITESNVWNRGFGIFTQAPAAAGISLFVHLANDNGRTQEAAYYTQIVERLMHGVDLLYKDAENQYLTIPEGIGKCFATYVPYDTFKDDDGVVPQKIGLSCYSLAAPFFLLDPQVALLSPDDPRIQETITLAQRYLGDPFDMRMIRWHIGRPGSTYPHPSHMGYGQGQLLTALLYTGRDEEFRTALTALFDVSFREVGDPYLMQEVLARPGNPNRGNKAHLTYYPLLAHDLTSRAKNGFPTPIQDLHQ